MGNKEGSYSIGCITMDPNNSNVIWVGTGENNNQRSVAFGDGIYRSNDGGKSWKNMGLKESEHIGKIIVHPDNSDKVYVAAIGPLWNSGGDRGVYRTTDGGENWEAILTIDEHTGVTDLVMDPRDPMVMYAAAFQRRRHVFTYLGGGPESTIYKTTDGGETWNKVDKGLPKVDLGRIGLAISPANPEVIFAIVEASQGKSGFYASTNRGASWQKRGSYVTSGNYYQEIVVDPQNPDLMQPKHLWRLQSIRRRPALAPRLRAPLVPLCHHGVRRKTGQRDPDRAIARGVHRKQFGRYSGEAGSTSIQNQQNGTLRNDEGRQDFHT